MGAPLAPLSPGFQGTVGALHRVAEELVAPARKPDNEISLRATPGGFGTPEFEFGGVPHQVRVEGVELVHSIDGEERRAPLGSLAEAADAVADLLPVGSAPAADPLEIDPAAADALAAWYALGDEVLARLVALAGPEDAATIPRLWPEHFDIAVELGEEGAGRRANYGFSPGDEEHPEPYAYVGPWTAEVGGEMWAARGFNGAELSYDELRLESDPAVVALNFFTTRWDLLKKGNAK